MPKTLFVMAPLAVVLAVLSSACNLNEAAQPTRVPSPTPPPNTSSTLIYQDLSSLVFNPGGPARLGDGSTQNVDPFWMYQAPVSESQYALCVATGACTPPDPQVNPYDGNPTRSGLPVDGVSPLQAQAYCAWMGGSLPTEAQFRILLPPGPCAGADQCKELASLTSQVVACGSSANPQAFCRTTVLGGFQDAPEGAGGLTHLNELPVFPTGASLQAVQVDAKNFSKGLYFQCVVPKPVVFAPMCALTRVANKDFPPMVCPVPEVSIVITGGFCSGGQAYFSVEIDNADAYDVGLVENAGTANAQTIEKLQNCTVDKTSTTAKTHLTCTGDPNSTLTVYAQEFCKAPANSTAGNPCLDGYTYDASAKMCMYSGQKTGVIACPTGFTLSPLGCSAAAKNYPASCPAGYVLEDTLGCTPYTSLTHTIHQDATLPACSAPTLVKGGTGTKPGGSGGTCSISCPAGQHVNAYTCTCAADKP